MAAAVAPRPIAPPRGLTGILDGEVYEANAPLDVSKMPKSMVLVNVYDVGDSELLQSINKVTTASNNILVGGVFHAGVEVFGAEWSYGFCEGYRTGVCAVHPRMNSQHNYRTTVPMGETSLTEEEVNDVISKLSGDWPGNEYDLIHHNCCSFCNAFLKELGLRHLPGWVDRAARAASAIDRTSRKVAQDTEQTVALVRSMTADIERKARALADEETLERTTASWLDVAYAESAKIAEAMQPWGEKVAERAQEGMQQLDVGLAQEIDVGGVAARAKEQAEALRSSFFSWGRGIYEVATQSLEALEVPASDTRKVQQTKPVTNEILADDLSSSVVDDLTSNDELLLKFVQSEEKETESKTSEAPSTATVVDEQARAAQPMIDLLSGDEYDTA